MVYDPPCIGIHALCNDGSWDVTTHPLSDAENSIFEIIEDYEKEEFGTEELTAFSVKQLMFFPSSKISPSVAS